MGIETALIASAVVGAVSTGYSIYQGEKQRSAQSEALNQQRQAQAEAAAAAQKQQKASEEAMNRANQKTPTNVNALMDAASRGATSSTMLTGPAGLNPNDLALGKSTLLGK